LRDEFAVIFAIHQSVQVLFLLIVAFAIRGWHPNKELGSDEIIKPGVAKQDVPKCQGRMRIIAFIKDEEVLGKILKHL
jgi:hypothetical protein